MYSDADWANCPETSKSIHPYDKVAKEEGKEFTIAVVDDDARLNPFVAWRRHLEINAALSTSLCICLSAEPEFAAE